MAEKLIIIGSGCAGLTAALYASRASLSPLVFEGKMPGGLLTTTTTVENFPGFPEGIDGFELTVNIRKQAEKFGARYETDTIEKEELCAASSHGLIQPSRKATADGIEKGDKGGKGVGEGVLHRLYGSSGKVYETRALIVATGASPRLLGIKGEKEYYTKGVHTCATCDGAFYRGKEVAVIGGGDSACEEAHFLTHFASKVTIVHRRDSLRASKVMALRVINNPKIAFVWNSGIEEYLGENGKLKALKLKNLVTGATDELPVAGAFVAIGHTPQTEFLKGALPMDEAGYLQTVAPSLVRTCVEGVWAAGECSDHVYRQAITSAGMGCMAALEAERFLAGSFHA